MTQQYILGELSCLVGELEQAAGTLGCLAHSLRWEIEVAPLSGLPGLTRAALELGDRVCWVSLEGGEVSRFCRCAATGAAVFEFASSANLLP